MSYADNPYRSWGMVAAEANVDERADFIRKTYLHLAGAVLIFAGLEALLLNTPGVSDLALSMIGSRFSWLVVLGLFIGVSWIAENWAQSATSVKLQYAGLALYVVAEAVIFLPLLTIASRFGPPGVISTAAILTGVTFGGLTAIVFMSGADFSFLRTGLYVAGLAALGLIVCASLFGFNLGIVFTAAMIALACGYILYDTSNVMRRYQIVQHVAAALALFAAVALLFWYILQLLMSLNRR